MHVTRVILKNGNSLDGIVWSVRPSEGWFSLIVEDEELFIKMDNCESVVTEGERISRDNVGNQDMLAEWVKRAEEERSK